MLNKDDGKMKLEIIGEKEKLGKGPVIKVDGKAISGVQLINYSCTKEDVTPEIILGLVSTATNIEEIIGVERLKLMITPPKWELFKTEELVLFSDQIQKIITKRVNPKRENF